MPGKAYAAGVGDTVMDLKQTQSLPDVVGKTDIFGCTRDAGRVIVRFIGLDGNQAIYVRQDVVIQSNETTMSQTPLLLPNYQTSTVTGNVGTIPVSATQTTVGTPTYIPPSPSSSYPIQAGQIQLAAPIGGSVLVEGQRIRVLRTTTGPASRRHRGRSCLRQSDCYAMDFHLLTDALQVLVVARHRA